MDEPTTDALYEHAPCGLLLTQTDGRIIRANATFARWIGFSVEQLTGGRRVQDLLTIGGKVFHQTHLAPLMQMQGSVAEVKLDLAHRDGHSIPALFSAVRRTHAGRSLDEIAVMVATDRQKYERELLIARKAAESANAQLASDDRRKDEFLATLAHELRGPLAPMRNVLEVLNLKDVDDPEWRWARGVLDRQLGQITHLVEDLLDVSRITQGKLTLRRTVLSLADAVEAAFEAARPLIEAAHQTASVDLPADPIWVDADLTRLTQVILNLLVNASKFTPASGKLWVTARVDGGSAVLAVRDSGVGISAAQLPGIFQMFSQAQPALQRAHGGLGIGLALVRGLVDLHGGHITATSPGIDQGSEFTVRLPIVAPAQAAAPLPQAARTVIARRILVVDDNVDSAESLAALLRMEGHDVRIAFTGRSALQQHDEDPAEFMLLDLGLPEMSGFEVAREVRSRPDGRTVRLVAITGWGDKKDIAASREAGFDHHLTKPIRFEALEEILLLVGGAGFEPATPAV